MKGDSQKEEEEEKVLLITVSRTRRRRKRSAHPSLSVQDLKVLFKQKEK